MMASMAEKSAGLQALDTNWLDEAHSQASGPGCGVAGLFTWDGDAGADFAAEVESVSRLFPHLDGLPAELTGGSALSVAQQAAVCGGTCVVLGAGAAELTPGSPADPALASPGDQCLMSPSDALLASPDPSLGSSPPGAALLGSAAAGDWKVATGGLTLSEMAHIPAENTVADQITTLIDFVQPARAAVARPPPAEEIFVSPADLEMKTTPRIHDTSTQSTTIADRSSSTSVEELSAASPVGITSPAAFETAAASGSPTVEVVGSPAVDFLPLSVEDDEHTRMIDQALEDLKTLESMCGIKSEDAITHSASSSPSVAVRSTSAATTSQAPASSAPASPAAKPVPPSDIVKQEPVKEEDGEIEIVEERPPPRRRRRRRPPRVAVTPSSASATQIVIVFTSEQLACIQKSGQIVLNAAALQPSLAAAEALASKAQKAQTSVKAQSKTPAGKAQTVVRSSTVVRTQTGARSVTAVKPTSSVTRTVTSGASTSAASTSGTASTSTVAGRAVKRPRVIVKQEQTKRVKRTMKRPASAKDPLSGWLEQKIPPAGTDWDLPLLPAQALEQDLPPTNNTAGIPDDLQDVLLDGSDSGAVPSLPADTADCLLEELFSGTVRENPSLFEGVPPAQVALKPAGCGEVMLQELPPPQPPLQQAGVVTQQPQAILLTPPSAGFSLSPQPQQQVTLESWVPALCPSPPQQPVSPSSECSSPELAPAPDWQLAPAARRAARRPRPYDKQPAGRTAARRQTLTEQERRDRKKEQNKNAATRYRQKKKEEHDLVSGDQEMLEARNKVLRKRVGDLSRELDYLKQLMREVLRHKQVSA